MRPVLASAPALVPAIALCLTLGTGPGCRKAPPPPPPAAQAPAAAAPSAPAPAASASAAQPAPAFAYNPEGMRDPFASLLRVKSLKTDVPEEQLTPLERVSVADLRLEGVILMGRKSVAHVITPDGKAHIVGVGTPMGRNRGRVVRIQSDAIVVEERFEDFQGKEIRQETLLRLREKEEGENTL